MTHYASPSDCLDATLRCADQHYEREDWPAARDSLRIARNLAPADPEILRALGSLHFQLRELSQASVAFTAALRCCPDDPDLLTQLAMTQLELLQLDTGETLVRRALALQPSHRPALKLLATLLHQRHEPEEAARVYYQLLQQNLDDVDVLLALGHCIVACGDLASARDVFEHVLDLAPDHPIASANLNFVLQRLEPSDRHRLPIADHALPDSASSACVMAFAA